MGYYGSMFGLGQKEESLLRELSTPRSIQDFLDRLAMNHEKRGETYQSPRLVLKTRKAHCMEGALLAAAALWLQGQPPLLMDFRTTPLDEDHVVALYRVNGYWGAISKTNHAILRFRDPVYRTLRELALSYFHEYFDFKTGEKTLREYSKPFALRKLGAGWITAESDLHWIAQAVDDSRHYPLVPARNLRHLRPADRMELAGGKVIEWPKTDPRT
ncbi:MAG TPA: hypothetical protein VF439_00250 [Candidatus Paceibacterota bacterium]